MRYLLDTGVLLWFTSTPNKLNRRATRVLSAKCDEIFFSAASSWEIVIKLATGKLTLPAPAAEFVRDWMANLALRPLDITHRHTLTVGELPAIHSDPFDRVLIAQAHAEGLTLLTADPVFEAYGARFLWSGR